MDKKVIGNRQGDFSGKWSEEANPVDYGFENENTNDQETRNRDKNRNKESADNKTDKSDEVKLSIDQIVKNLRGFIDLEAIAEREDPSGLKGAQRAGVGIEKHILAIQEEISENEVRLGELEMELDDTDTEEKDQEQVIHDKIIKRKRSFWSKIKGFLGIRDNKLLKLYEKRKKVQDDARDKYNEIYRMMSDVEQSSKQLNNKLKDLDPEQPKEDFLKKFETPLSEKDKKENLRFEALSELTTDEYLALWRRLNPNFIMKKLGEDKLETLEREKVNIAKEPKGTWGDKEKELGKEKADAIKKGLGERGSEAFREKSPRAFISEKERKEKERREKELKNEPKPIFVVFPTDVATSQLGVGIDYNNRRSAEDGLLKSDEVFISAKNDGVPVDAGVMFIPKNSEGKGWQFFEEHFEKHPEQRPAHIVYYEGKPLESVNDLLREQGIARLGE